MNCPKCNSMKIGIIHYGPPWAMTAEMQKKLNEGQIQMAGCIFTEYSPTNFCQDCKFQWVDNVEHS